MRFKGVSGDFTARQLVLSCALLAFVMTLLILVLSDRFMLAIPRMHDQCLNWNVGILDKYDRKVSRGKTYAFYSLNIPGRKDGLLLVKRFVGTPLDLTEVTPSQDVLINGRKAGHGLEVGMTLKVKPEFFTRKNVLDFGRYWGLGDRFGSYDSRYWGSIDESQIAGRLHILF